MSFCLSVRPSVCLFVYRLQRVLLQAAKAYRVGRLGHISLLIPIYYHRHPTFTVQCSAHHVGTYHVLSAGNFIYRLRVYMAAIYPYKEVDGEENIEDEIDLLCCTFRPLVA